ncbi:hypothetical protein QQG74_09250 [Micromonospora sp. FIMYZ51]|uniref:hypothetical protein n=1 Tax=Micromonospora sp. FIMYZ51 TaxID=3051832 RepID=UPI003120101D
MGAANRTDLASVATTFHRKAREIADANGWTVEDAEAVMLRYLHSENPQNAATVAAALLVESKAGHA